MLSSRTRLILATALLAPILLYWGADRAPTEAQAPQIAPGGADTDYYLRDATIRQFDARGLLHQELRSPQLEHYPEPGELRAQAPDITLFSNEDRGEVLISAQQGLMQDSDEQVRLNGAVKVLSQSAGKPLRLETQTLSLLPSQQFIETDTAVTLFSQGGETRANGMKAYLNTRQVELLSDVEGRYETK
ncbi:LPS export ABC transporter periplasmic protein LptC [Marinobacterium rhizophilum]|uniref:Lipopolysaccharide export system protein LptC n=1 Tax=Marinobacterium rhizophilum TaxID=420402 RepID=A0ABY5HS48_9GAMM|nr:LPS export ABC transporter periplasmic protein LptC [Marinobacterium rhizophilum]UTW14000.1 LPS export ABC transporter periplasmic protein LptC [Marinobacterium rhizophilum]